MERKSNLVIPAKVVNGKLLVHAQADQIKEGQEVVVAVRGVGVKRSARTGLVLGKTEKVIGRGVIALEAGQKSVKVDASMLQKLKKADIVTVPTGRRTHVGTRNTKDYHVVLKPVID